MTRSYRRDAKSRLSSVQNQVKRRVLETNESSLYEAEWTPQEKSSYAKAMKELRASYGLTDGLRLSSTGMNDYLARRRAEDQKRRGW